MHILMLGVKEYPYGISAKHEKYPGGGTARFVIGLSSALAINGHTVYLIVRKMHGQLKFENDKGLNIYRVNWINNKYFRWPSFSFLAFIQALRIIKKIDIIHTHGSFDAVFGIILARLFKKKVIGTSHGLTSYQAKTKYNSITVLGTRLLEKFSFKRLHKIVFLTQAEKDLIEQQLKVHFDNPVILNMGIEPLIILREKANKFKVVFIGRLIPIKGLDKLILSLNYIENNIRNDLEIIIVGDGFYKEELIKIASINNFHEIVKFPGFTTDISNYLKDASVFILPSEGGEGLPVSLLEAMSIGIPCIISNFAAPFSGEALIYLENNSPETIAKTILYYYRKQNELISIGKQGKTEFEQKFSLETTVIEYIRIYSNIIEENIK